MEIYSRSATISVLYRPQRLDKGNSWFVRRYPAEHFRFTLKSSGNAVKPSVYVGKGILLTELAVLSMMAAHIQIFETVAETAPCYIETQGNFENCDLEIPACSWYQRV